VHKISFFKYILFLFVSIIASFFFCANAYSGAISPSAQNYTPNLWFDSQEQYYPANPLDFYFENNIEISGEKAVQKYNKLSQQEKINNLIVFYHIQDNGDQWVYQYWFFYVFNNYQKGVQNKHYGDWEAVYVFVNKNSGEVIKVISTAHQRKLFDTEIYSPNINHIWSYIANGSHANCIDKKDDGRCDFLKWRGGEKWDKNGYKAMHNSYNLIEITPDYINQFNDAKTLENSPVLGINVFDLLMIENKEFYLPLGGNPPIYAWEQSSYYNPNEIVPISVKYITEYISNKANQAKSAVAGFFNNAFSAISDLFKKAEPEKQQAGMINSLKKEEDNKKEEKIEVEIKEDNYIKDTALEPSEPRHGLESDNLPEIEIEIEIEKEVEVEIEEIQENPSVVSLTPPLGFPFFIGGGASLIEDEPSLIPASTSTIISTTTATTATSTPQIIDTIPPSNIIDLTANIGNNRGEINLSWTAPGDDQSSGTSTEYIIKYATSSEITLLNWASSTDIIGEPTPALASSTENFSINNLNINQTYYWAIKSKDKANNISGISNCASSIASALGDNVIINEVQLGINEFVELYNPTNQDIDMSGWYWSYFSSTRDWNKPSSNKEFPSNAVIPANGYYLIGLYDFLQGEYIHLDWMPSSYRLSDDNGSIAIFSANPATTTPELAKEGLVDAVGWGAVDYVSETTPTSASEKYKTIIRQTLGWDTNNNSSDFIESNWPTLQNSLGEKITIIADEFVFNQDVTFIKDDSPYILRSNLGKHPTVQDGSTLTIEPGVVVRGSNKNYPSLIIKGTLKAQGTSANPITFTSATTTQSAGDWSGIIFDNSISVDSVLGYVIFEYGGYEVNYGGDQIKEMIRINNSYVSISNSIFQYSQNNGIYLNNSNSLISNSVFNNNTLTGIIINSSSPSVIDSQFSNNDIGIEIINQASPIISNNVFSDNNKVIKIKSSYPNLSANQTNNNNLNGIFVDSESIFSQNTTWNNNLPYILGAGLGDCLTIATGTVLTIEPGVVIKSDRPYTILSIEGELIALGATSTPIVFTSLKDDVYGSDTNNDGSITSPLTNDWKNIQFIAGSKGELNYIIFRYGTAPVLDINTNATVNIGSNIVYEP